jgi:hypothetical protein
MRLAALTLVLAALAVAAPAWAQSPAPSVVTFAAPVSDTMFDSPPACPTAIVATGGRDGGPFLRVPCGIPQLRIVFSAPQSLVELFVRAPDGGETLIVTACGPQSCDGDEIAREQITPAPPGWSPVIIRNPTGAATIYSVSVDVPGLSVQPRVDIDDVSFSPSSDNPDTNITSRVGGFDLTTNHPLGGSFVCELDGGALSPCSRPVSLSGLAVGEHDLTALAVDVYGRTDPSRQGVHFTVQPPFTPPPDGDKDGVPDATDNCPADANANQADGDSDGVGDACELLPSGNTPPTAGVTAVVRQLSGEVFVKLPARRGFKQETGFIPLKGVAAIPIGSTVDARKGEIEVASAANGYAASDKRAKRQQARIKAGMFAIRQKRAKRNAAKKTAIGTDVALLSPAGAETQCRRSGPSKGVVRSVSMVVKGLYRAIGGATTATAKSATFATTDRCDGTLTEVGKGRVTVAVKGRKKPVVVRGGGAYFAKARLFAARKGKRPPPA